MTARFANPDRALHSYFKVDGCLVNNERAADWVVMKDNVGAVVVELKGKDVMRGVSQISETVRQVRNFLPERHGGRIAGLLVSVRVPKGARTDLQRAQTQFRRDFRRNLKTCNGKKNHSFAELLD